MSIVVVFAIVLLVQVYGCGNSTDRYVEKVLERWPAIESLSTEARQALGDYQYAREYGGADLEDEVWCLAPAGAPASLLIYCKKERRAP